MNNKDWRTQYPLSTFSGTTHQEIVEFVENRLKKQKDEILNLECLKEEELPKHIHQEIWGGENGFSTTIIDSPDVFGETAVNSKNQLRKEIKEKIKKL